MFASGLIATLALFGLPGGGGDALDVGHDASNALCVHESQTGVSDFCAHVDRNVEGFLTPPYHDSSLIYGYFDYGYTRGPILTLGNRTLLPGFRGYGLLFSPGYGVGLRPNSYLDLDHFNGGPWYHKFPRTRPAPAWVNQDPGTPGRRL